MKAEYPAPHRIRPEEVPSLPALFEFLEESSAELGWPVSLSILSSSTDLAAMFRRWGTVYQAEQLGSVPGTWALDVPRRADDHAVAQCFAIDLSPGVVLLASNEHRDLLKAPIHRWVQRYQPLVSPILLNTGAMRRVLHSVSRSESSEIKVMLSRVSWRGKLPVATQRKFLESSQVWTDRPFGEVFDELRDQKRWVTSVHFAFGLRDGTGDTGKVVEGSMSRGGEFTSSGWLLGFFKSVASAAADEARRERGFFADRAVESSPTGRFRPLVIQYDEPVFADRSQNRLLIRVLETLPNAGISILHPNPYLRAAVVDYIDGSAYDVWVVAQDRITVIPKTRTSPVALERLCAHLCGDFRDGDILDYEEAAATPASGNE